MLKIWTKSSEHNDTELMLKLENQRLLEVINESQVASDQMIAAVHEVDQSVFQLTKIADQSTSAGVDLQSNGQQALVEIQQASSILYDTAKTASEMNQSCRSMEEQAEATSDSITMINQSLEKTNEEAKQLVTFNKFARSRIEALISQSQEITRMNQMIQSVSRQTSLLSFNASIEAARAGEHGNGFAVVAKEIKKLADQNAEASKHSSIILEGLEQAINEVVQSVKEEKDSVDSLIHEIKEITNQLGSIHSLMNQTTGLINQTREDSERQSEKTKEAAIQLERVVNRVEQTIQSVDQTVIFIENQHSEISHLNLIGQDLTRTSANLATSVGKLDLNSQTTTTMSADDIHKMTQLVKEIAAESVLKTSEKKDHEAILLRYYHQVENIEAIWSNQDNGSFIFSYPKAGLLNANQRKWWKEAMEGVYYHSEPYISAITKGTCVTFSAPIKRDGLIIGVVGVDITIDTKDSN